MDNEKLKLQIIEMERSALEQWNQGDPSGFLEIYAPQITYFDPMQEYRMDGYEKLAEYYAQAKGNVHIERYEMIHPVVELTDRMAVLSYNLHSFAGNNVWRWNCTEVYKMDSEDQWKIVHNHWSIVQPPVR